MREILDKIGQPITIGSFIAYGHALGRCAGLRIGKVLDITEKKKSWSNELSLAISVWGIDDDWSCQEVKLCRTRGTLLFPERILF